MTKSHLKRFCCLVVLVSLTGSQLGCSIAERMREPIGNFKGATTLVTTNARKAYNAVNGPAVTKALKEAQLKFKTICNPTPSAPADAGDDTPACREGQIDITAARILSDADLAARFDALQSLDEYADLLFKVVNSDAPEKIEASASKLKKSLDDLAVRIADLSESNPRRGTGSANQPNTEKFKKAFGLFSTVVAEVLTLFARKKRDNALKKAIEEGEKPVSDLIEAINEDVAAFWMNDSVIFENRVRAATRALNTELDAAKGSVSADERKQQIDQAQLTRLRDDLTDAINDQATFDATNPSEAIAKMGVAHKKMVEYARRPTSASFIESVKAIELFAASAARLGAAVVKLAEDNDGR